ARRRVVRPVRGRRRAAVVRARAAGWGRDRRAPGPPRRQRAGGALPVSAWRAPEARGFGPKDAERRRAAPGAAPAAPPFTCAAPAGRLLPSRVTSSRRTKVVMARILGDVPGTAAPVGADVSVVGRGLRIQGECEVPGRLVVEGHITGDVRAAQLEVVPGGRVDGSVSGPDGKAPASSVVVAGRVGGEVRGGRVEVHDKG